LVGALVEAAAEEEASRSGPGLGGPWQGQGAATARLCRASDGKRRDGEAGKRPDREGRWRAEVFAESPMRRRNRAGEGPKDPRRKSGKKVAAAPMEVAAAGVGGRRWRGGFCEPAGAWDGWSYGRPTGGNRRQRHGSRPPRFAI